MKNPWIRYTLFRLGMFFGVFLILMLLDFNPFFAAIIAAALSFALSLLTLDRERNAISAQVAAKLTRDDAGKHEDLESDLENQALDESEIDDGEPKPN